MEQEMFEGLGYHGGGRHAGGFGGFPEADFLDDDIDFLVPEPAEKLGYVNHLLDKTILYPKTRWTIA